MTVPLTTPYDVAEHLRTPEESAAYLEACLEEANGDPTFIAKALDDVARASHIRSTRYTEEEAVTSTQTLMKVPNEPVAKVTR